MIKPCLFYLLFLLFAGSNPPHAIGDEEALPISVKAEIQDAFITIGEPIVYTITIRHHPEIDILSKATPSVNAIFNIQNIEEFKRKEGVLIIEGWKMKLTTYQLGEYILDPIIIQYHDNSGNIQTIETNKIYLTVESVAAGEEKNDIRGIKPVLTMAQKLYGWIVLLMLLLLSALAGWLALKFRKKPAVETKESAPLSPYEEAMYRLNKLFDSDLIRTGYIKEYYLLLSEILRNYFEKIFHILAVESTTDEIVRAMKKKKVDPALIDKIHEVLEAADLAKFAKWRPEPVHVIQINKKSKQIVDAASPKKTNDHV